MNNPTSRSVLTVILATLLAYMSSIACSTSQQLSSTEIESCRAHISSDMSLMTATAKRDAFRKCIKSTRNRQEQLTSSSAHDAISKLLPNESAPSTQPSGQEMSATTTAEIIKFCSFNQIRVKELLGDYHRSTSYLNNIIYSGKQLDIDAARLKQSVIIEKLDALIPQPYRAGQALIPHAASMIARCDSREIEVILENENRSQEDPN